LMPQPLKLHARQRQGLIRLLQPALRLQQQWKALMTIFPFNGIKANVIF